MEGRKVIAMFLLCLFLMAALMPPTVEADDDDHEKKESNKESNACTAECEKKCKEDAASSYLGTVEHGFCMAKCYTSCGVGAIKDKFAKEDEFENTTS